MELVIKELENQNGFEMQEIPRLTLDNIRLRCFSNRTKKVTEWWSRKKHDKIESVNGLRVSKKAMV